MFSLKFCKGNCNGTLVSLAALVEDHLDPKFSFTHLSQGPHLRVGLPPPLGWQVAPRPSQGLQEDATLAVSCEGVGTHLDKCCSFYLIWLLCSLFMNAVELQVLLHTFVLTPSKGFPELGSNFDAQSNNCIMRSFLAADGCISFFLFSHIDSLLDSLSSDACNIHSQSMYNAIGNTDSSLRNYIFKVYYFM